MADKLERFQKITDHGVIPSPSGAGALVLHGEEGLDCLMVLGVFRPVDKAQLAALVTFERCMQSVFGYPNDEAYWHDPRGTAGDRPGYGFFEVLDSTWLDRLIAYNRHAFPDRTPAHWLDLHHYFVGCHDTSGQFLARGMKVELMDESYEQVLGEALRRVTGAESWPVSSG